MKLKLGFFVAAAIVVASFTCRAQNNTMGDRGPDKIKQPAVKKQTHKIQKQHFTRRQRLLFKKPNVRHTAEYEYYARIEQIAREKRQLASKQKQLLKIPNLTYRAEYDFYKRIERAAHQKQQALRRMSKPQYTNFAYFGHKHPPKKHLPYAMRYCKECGIRH